MELAIVIDGVPIGTMQLDSAAINRLLQTTTKIARSTPLNREQADEIYRRVDPKSVHFLKKIAANNGSITFREMRDIFGIETEGNWSGYAQHYGRGITRALRAVLNNPTAQIVWWNDRDWNVQPEEQDNCKVFVDGAALDALRESSR
jgi:uncharacterized protein YdaL